MLNCGVRHTLLEHHCLENKHEIMLFSVTKMKIYLASLSN